MPIWRMQVAYAADSLFPTDRLIITPHFDDHGAATDPTGLANDLADAMVTYYAGVGEITVKAYDAQGTKPVYPQADVIRRAGAFFTTPTNRDVALCLSYYADRNRPRYRGRLYLPCCLLTITPSGARPSTSNQQKVADLVPILTNLGGADVDWVVYSRVDDVARPVKGWWVDNSWDTQRRRGVRPTSRLQGTVNE